VHLSRHRGGRSDLRPRRRDERRTQRRGTHGRPAMASRGDIRLHAPAARLGAAGSTTGGREMSASTWLSVDGLTVRYDHSPGARPTLDALSFAVPQGSTLGIVGESGSGKTTLAKAIVGTAPVSAGSVTLGGAPVLGARGAARRALRRRIQLIPQNPY